VLKIPETERQTPGKNEPLGVSSGKSSFLAWMDITNMEKK